MRWAAFVLAIAAVAAVPSKTKIHAQTAVQATATTVTAPPDITSQGMTVGASQDAVMGMNIHADYSLQPFSQVSNPVVSPQPIPVPTPVPVPVATPTTQTSIVVPPTTTTTVTPGMSQSAILPSLFAGTGTMGAMPVMSSPMMGALGAQYTPNTAFPLYNSFGLGSMRSLFGGTGLSGMFY